jgi:hypothetical protein
MPSEFSSWYPYLEKLTKNLDLSGIVKNEPLNIYLDIDGVLLANDTHVAEYADEFITYILDTFPDTAYWLTTHCWHGENNAVKRLRGLFPKTTLSRMEQLIQPTDWGTLKTDAIDFTKSFLWFDDDLYVGEKAVLEAHGALDGHVMVDLQKNPAQLKDMIAMLKWRKTPI